MAEQLILTCDSCRCRIDKRNRTKIRFSAEPYAVGPVDLCGECRVVVLRALGLMPPEGQTPVFPGMALGVPTS